MSRTTNAGRTITAVDRVQPRRVAFASAVGVLPTYGQVGLLAPILLVIVRFAQGISAGGEWAGAALMAVEHAPAEQRGRFGAYSRIGVPAGLILAQLAFFVVRNSLSPEQFAAWGCSTSAST